MMLKNGASSSSAGLSNSLKLQKGGQLSFTADHRNEVNEDSVGEPGGMLDNDYFLRDVQVTDPSNGFVVAS